MRVAIVIKYWVDTQLDDLDDEIILQLYNFIEKLSDLDNHKKIADYLRQRLITKVLPSFPFFFLLLNLEQTKERQEKINLWFQDSKSHIVCH
jgi:hypothetical protein